MSHEEKIEMIEALRHIMGIFVDIAWGEDTTNTMLREKVLEETNYSESDSTNGSQEAST